MRKNLLKRMVLTILAMAAFIMEVGAATVDIPTKAGTYISWNDATGSGYNVENGGANVGSTGKSTSLSFIINNTQQQDYLLTFKTGTKSAAKMKVTLTNASGKEVLGRSVDIENTNSWTPSIVHNYMLKQLPEGAYTLKFAVTQASGYAGNWGDLAFYTLDGVPAIPGSIALTAGSYGGGMVNEGENAGYIKDGAVASYNVRCQQAGVYTLKLDLARYGTGGTLDISVKDAETGHVEATAQHVITGSAPSSYTANTIVLQGELEEGLKILTLQFKGGSGYICNYRNLQMDYYAAHLATIRSVSISGQTVTNGDDTDWLCNLPAEYAPAETTISALHAYGTVTATATDAVGQAVSVTARGDGTFSLPTPQQGQAVIVSLHITPTAKQGLLPHVRTTRCVSSASAKSPSPASPLTAWMPMSWQP